MNDVTFLKQKAVTTYKQRMKIHIYFQEIASMDDALLVIIPL
jgi:hypothetical protein